MFNQVYVNAPRSSFFDGNATPSASCETLPLDVLNARAYLAAYDRGAVGDRIQSAADKAEARKTVEAVLGKDYVNTISELDLDDEFNNYNRSEAFKCVTFLDWYTLRDYKQAGYTRVNRPLKDLHDAGHAKPGTAGTPMSEHAQALVARLADAMDKAIEFQQKEIQTGLMEEMERVVYSGTDMSLAALHELQPGSVYEYPAFLSTTTDEDVADEFISVPDESSSNRAGVLYEIELAPESNALDIGKILKDGEAEILFPPKTKFVVREVSEVNGIFKVSLSEISEKSFRY